MDWFTILYGRPAAQEPTLEDYLRNPEDYPEVEAAGSLPRAARRASIQAQRGPLPETLRDARREVERRQHGRATSAPGVPFSAASADRAEDVRPFGDDFSLWSDAVDAASRPPLPAGVGAVETEDPVRFPWGLNTETGAGADAYAPREDVAEQRRPEPGDAEPRPGFDPTREWSAAEQRAAPRRRQPGLYDTLFAVIFGQRGGGSQRFNQIERETREMRERVRPRQPTVPDLNED